MSHAARALRDPSIVLDFDSIAWDNLLGELRSLNMLARMSALLGDKNLLDAVPANAADVFRGAATYVDYLQNRACYEISNIGKLAASVDYPVVLLKGAAYLLAKSPASRGRALNDIDILVPAAHLADFESRLNRTGWKQAEQLSDYDNYYYRALSHEVPPKRHPKHQLELDLHHNILQPTHRIKVDITQMLDASSPLELHPFHSFSLPDQILHSATHLLMSDELRGGLRDLHDIFLLYQDGISRNANFDDVLVARAFQIGLQRPLYYAMDCAKVLFDLSLSALAAQQLETAAPPAAVANLMRRMVIQRIAPEGRQGSWAEQALYIRSHLIRMPPALLLRHLTRKALVRGAFKHKEQP